MNKYMLLSFKYNSKNIELGFYYGTDPFYWEFDEIYIDGTRHSQLTTSFASINMLIKWVNLKLNIYQSIKEGRAVMATSPIKTK